MPAQAGHLSATHGRGAGNRRFDAQAERFDRRAGLPPEAVAAVAREVAAMAAPVAGGVLLEVGAGTGEIGAPLAAESGMPYVGLDLSLPMLERFRARQRAPAHRGRRGLIVQADADRPWPLRGGQARIVFLSRAVHLLDLDRLVAEAGAAAHPRGCALVMGRVRRDGASVHGELRRRMRALLAGRGIDGRSGELAQRRLLEALARQGARPRPSHAAATWTVEERPARILAAWRDKPGLAGAALASEVQSEVLVELEDWARARFGDLSAPRPARESYELVAIDLPARAGAGAEPPEAAAGDPTGEGPA